MSDAASGATAAVETTAAAGTRRVAYLTTRYPAISHTFIAREVAALRERGFEVSTFAIRPTPAEDLVSDPMREEAARTTALVGGGAGGAARALLALARRPRAALAGLRAALAWGDRTPRARLWQLFYLGEAAVLFEAMARRGLRHVHVHHANVPADVARLACRMGDAVDGPGSWRWTLSLHGSAEFSKIEQWDIAAKITDAHAVACISDYCKAQVLPFVDEAHWPRLSVVRMGVDPQRFAPCGSPTDEPSARPLRLLTVGRLDPVKGFPVLLRAVADLVAQGRAVELRVVGQGPMRDRLLASAAGLGLPGEEIFVGARNEAEVVEEMRRADVFVMSSFNEGLPVVLMEAMASGLPVVTTAVGAVGELVTHGVDGLVVPPTNAAALAAAVATLQDDPERRRAMGRAGREAVCEEFVLARTGDAMGDFLRATVVPT
ncbi:glycosyltransferase family 4 protein [Arthrobacter sp. NEB 688]|uniref:glycosyltransferase family 4 protein n=1 Tax=Arthrobacter sp. NEB 688 TaxID=904039 RepID=UPI0015651F0E|nr:glycosyltransferase family 4 protein [Arthrobacter sp. NEB 688]QKE85308.1 glycosyltransferase family 4 protein [Arthrobacter sp. NEB 688]